MIQSHYVQFVRQIEFNLDVHDSLLRVRID